MENFQHWKKSNNLSNNSAGMSFRGVQSVSFNDFSIWFFSVIGVRSFDNEPESFYLYESTDNAEFLMIHQGGLLMLSNDGSAYSSNVEKNNSKKNATIPLTRD